MKNKQKKGTSTKNIQKVIIFHKNLQQINLSNSMPHQKINNLLGLMKETGVDLPD